MSQISVGQENKKRANYQFKILYSILMFGVLCGHLGAVDIFIPWTELFSIYGFGIQLFLFISGYFYSTKYDSTPHVFILKKLKTILLPLVVWNFVYGLVCLVLSRLGFTFTNSYTLAAFTYESVIYGPRFSFISPAWFILPFFIAVVFTVLERFAVSRIRSEIKDFVILAVNMCINFASIWYVMHNYNEYGYYQGNYKTILQAMFMIPYFSIGFIYKTYLEKHDKIGNLFYFLIVIALDVLYITINGHSSSYFVSVMGGYENILFPTVTAIIGIAFYLRISRVFTPVIGQSKAINLIGDNTFSIMIHHEFGFFVLSSLLVLAAKIIPFFPEPDFNAYFADSSYHYMPRGRGWPIVYVIFGFTYSIAVPFAVEKIKGVIMGKMKKGEKLYE